MIDFNEDGFICEKDLKMVIEKLTNGKLPESKTDRIIKRVRIIGILCMTVYYIAMSLIMLYT